MSIAEWIITNIAFVKVLTRAYLMKRAQTYFRLSLVSLGGDKMTAGNMSAFSSHTKYKRVSALPVNQIL